MAIVRKVKSLKEFIVAIKALDTLQIAFTASKHYEEAERIGFPVMEKCLKACWQIEILDEENVETMSLEHWEG